MKIQLIRSATLRLNYAGRSFLIDPWFAAAGTGPSPELLAEMGEAAGFVFRAAGEPTLYWVGDTILCDAVCETITSQQPEVIVVHASGATWKGAGPLVMDEPMVDAVLRLAPEAVVVATHLDAVDHATASRASLRTCFGQVPERQDRLRIPAYGETLVFGTEEPRAICRNPPPVA